MRIRRASKKDVAILQDTQGCRTFECWGYSKPHRELCFNFGGVFVSFHGKDLRKLKRFLDSILKSTEGT